MRKLFHVEADVAADAIEQEPIEPETYVSPPSHISPPLLTGQHQMEEDRQYRLQREGNAMRREGRSGAVERKSSVAERMNSAV